VSGHVAPHRWADLARGELGGADERRMLAHAAACDRCARARDRVAGAVGAFEELGAAQAPELGWDTIRARVYWATSSDRREQARTAERAAIRRRRWRVVAVPAAAAVAAAAVAGVLIARSGDRPVRPAPRVAHAAAPPVAPVVHPPAALLTGVVTLAAGEVTVDGVAAPGAVLAHPLMVGSKVETGDGRLAVQFGDGSVFSVGPRSTLALRRFDGGTVELAIDGEVAIEVARRAPGQRFAVVAGGRTVEVRGTAFRVVRRDGALAVACGHGLVAVEDDSGDLLVPAGQGVTVGDDDVLAGRTARPLEPAALARLMTQVRPRLPVWTEPAALYRTSAPIAIAAPRGHAVRVDGVVVGTGALTLRVMSGRHLVEAEAARGRFVGGAWVEARPGHAAAADVGPAAAEPGRPCAPHTPNHSEARRARRADLEHGLDRARVNNCIRALAKQGLAGGTHIELDLGVTAGGAIRFLNVGDTDLPDSMASCIRDAAAAVRFPAGAAATFHERLSF
jgi:ferric-dicitrate binding protein FerR (iron transport regulator)